MKQELAPPRQSQAPDFQLQMMALDPRWNQLPAQYQRELVLTLAAMVIKQLPACHDVLPEVKHESGE